MAELFKNSNIIEIYCEATFISIDSFFYNSTYIKAEVHLGVATNYVTLQIL